MKDLLKLVDAYKQEESLESNIKKLEVKLEAMSILMEDDILAEKLANKYDVLNHKILVLDISLNKVRIKIDKIQLKLLNKK